MSSTLKVYLFALAVSTLDACSCPGGDLHEHINGRNETGWPASHARYDDQLHELITKMDVLEQERFMTQTELDKERRKYALGIADSAENLQQAVNKVIDRMPALQLSSSEQQAFLALAQQLSEQSGSLQEQARLNHIDVLDDLVRQINITCNSCHTLF